jgi:Glycoside hydrolase family 5 C-terminal domain/Cellulase (glycosyl hydrolase family 5)
MALPRLRIAGEWFVDDSGCRHLLRGVNLGGDCKIPNPDGGTHLPSDFADHRSVSFIGRPFPLEEAAEHFGRLRGWGFNCLRLLTTWEAVEHAGPGLYDEAYLDYFAELCRLAGSFGFYVFVDFHQDVWSRMTGGDGAPGWLFEAVGLDLSKFSAADAAHVMQHKYDFARGGRQEDKYPTMSWSQNYKYPANGIMWTLFFAGAAYCPDFMIDGQNVQDYLQGHYLGAMAAVAGRLKDMPHVIGFDSLNEPGSGYVGMRLSYRHVEASEAEPAQARPGLAWSPLDGLAVAQGLSREVPFLAIDYNQMKVVPVRTERLNPNGISIWLDGRSCPFEAAGAYRRVGDGIEALDEDFFAGSDGHRFDIAEDFMTGFFTRVAARIRAINPDWLLFAELDPGAGFSQSFPADTPSGTVNASHWYDIVTLVTKLFLYPNSYNPFTGKMLEGPAAIEGAYAHQLGRIKAAAATLNGGSGAPTVIGEFGIPFDLADSAAYKAWADGDRSDAPWERHVIALDLMYNALDSLLIGSTQWNYTASNRNDQAIGDGWNQEDLSIFSRDQQAGGNAPNDGGRALAGFVRPFARRIAGMPRAMRFDRTAGEFRFSYAAEAGGETEIFVPALHFPNGYAIDIEGAEATMDGANQRLLLRARAAGTVSLLLRRH